MAENNTEQKFWNCPKCGANGTRTDVRSIFDDTRFDIFECKCGCAWRHYYKIAQSICEVVRTPKEESTDAPKASVEASGAEAVVGV